MIEPLAVQGFIWSALVADSAPGGVNALVGGTPSTPGRIYQNQVPQAAALPAVLINVVTGTDANTLGGRRAFNVAVIDVRAIGNGASWASIKPIAARIDAVLQERAGSYDGVVIVKLVRDQPVPQIETESGTTFAHLLQTYRTPAYAAP